MLGKYSNTPLVRTIFGQRFANFSDLGRSRTYFFWKWHLFQTQPAVSHYVKLPVSSSSLYLRLMRSRFSLLHLTGLRLPFAWCIGVYGFRIRGDDGFVSAFGLRGDRYVCIYVVAELIPQHCLMMVRSGAQCLLMPRTPSFVGWTSTCRLAVRMKQ